MSSNPSRGRRRGRTHANNNNNNTNNNNGNTAEEEEVKNIRSPVEAEAESLVDVYEEEDVGDGEDEEGEDLYDNMEADYRAVAHLDQYDEEDLDNEEYDDIDISARQAADRVIRQRQRENRRLASSNNRGPRALMEESEDDIDDDDDQQNNRRIRRRIDHPDDGIDGGDEGEHNDQRNEMESDHRVNLDDFKGPLKEWLSLESTRKEVKRQLHNFLSNFRLAYEEKNPVSVYPPLIRRMCADNRSSLEVDYVHVSDAVPILGIWVADAPDILLDLFDEVLTKIINEIYPNYIPHMVPEVHIRIGSLPVIDHIRDLRHYHLNALVKVEGVVIRRTTVFPQLKLVKFNCIKCGAVSGPYAQNASAEITPGRCPECQSAGPFSVNSAETVYRNYQKITLQEAPNSVPAGGVPRQKEVILLFDLIDSVSPGELVAITGIYKHSYDLLLNHQNGFPVFQTMIVANHIAKGVNKLSSFQLTPEDVREIQALAKKDNIAQIIFNSIAPSIYGHDNIKMGIAFALFGGREKEFENGHRIRGDINVLVLGDPGTAKSQFLKYTEKTAYRSVYTTGKGASAVGLTASVHRDTVTREWTLEGGALVLADRGVCLIDEFDKMNDADRTSIHEAMEQQSISISKAGIVTSLKARCSVIAAANPIGGRYNSSLAFHENVDLSDAILSRFDVLAVVRDQVEMETDRRLASFVVDSHYKSHPKNAKTNAERSRSDEMKIDDDKIERIDQSLLRKYIYYAREHCRPELSAIDDNKIAKLYADLRRESLTSGGIPIAVRHVESMIRMAEAHAKIHLRSVVREDDVDVAIRVMLESFISTQKFSVMRSLRKQFDKYLSHGQDRFQLLLFTLHQLVQEAKTVQELQRNKKQKQSALVSEIIAKTTRSNSNHHEVMSDEESMNIIEISLDEFRDRANQLNINDLRHFLQSPKLADHGYSVQKDKIVKLFH